ncbi:MAG TPA: ATP-grasp domain-containing protein [Candidatus Acidoferrales bacterium]|nr:ATP-grasp domain-containing protein [Candidatus Acidoferrales bacterium]
MTIAPRKKLLLLASKLGYQTQGFAEAAASLGVDVQFATDRCHKLADPWGDGALPLHFEDPQSAAQEIVRQCETNPPDAILALGDRPTPTVAYAARALGLLGNDPESVVRCRNKLTQRQTLRAAGIPVPEFFSFAVGEALGKILPRVKFPCVVKPLSLAASQGVIRANDEEQFRAAVSRIRALLASPEIQVTREPALDQLLVERFMPGREVAIEGLLDRGQLRVLAIFDKPDLLEGPYFEETIYVTPSRLPESQQEALRDCAARAVSSLGLSHGPIHAEFRINEDGPWVLEIAPRPIGGLCSRALRFGPSRISLEELLLRHALDLGGFALEREEDASGVMMIPVPRSGIFERVEGIEDAERTPGVTEIRITARLKDYVAAWPEGSSYLGFIFARAATPAEAEAALRQAHAKLHFAFSPRLPVEHPATRRILSA